MESAGPLPGMEDFVPSDLCFDKLEAWKNFGKLTRTGAFDKFCSLPEVYQEDFMWMGGIAFAFYFPVIERYVFQAHVDNDENGEVEAIWILAHCIKQQLHSDHVRGNSDLTDRILVLIEHIRSNLSKFCKEPSEQKRVDEAWRELGQFLESCD